jgi:hypothetical protein
MEAKLEEKMNDFKEEIMEVLKIFITEKTPESENASHEICQLRNKSISEYLIKWWKLSAEDSTWEDGSLIQKHPELLKHCGKHLSQGEGHVKP